ETLPNSVLDCVLSQDLTAFCVRLFTAFCLRFFTAFCLRLFTAFCLRLLTAFCLRLFTAFCLRLFTTFCLYQYCVLPRRNSAQLISSLRFVSRLDYVLSKTLHCVLSKTLYCVLCKTLHCVLSKILHCVLSKTLHCVLSKTIHCIKQRIQAARDRQKSYADLKRKPMEFQVGDKVMLKVIARVGSVAYKLELPEELSRVHNTFHVSNLKKCYANEPLAVPLDGLHFDDKLQFVEEPVEIMDCEFKRLRNSRVLIFKVRWNSKRDDDILPVEEQPLPAAASPTTESPDEGDEGDDEDESSKDDEDDDIDIEGDEEEDEYLAPADSTPVALPAVDHAPSTEETESFETDESAATPPPHLAYRVTARMSIRPQTPISLPSDTEIARLMAIPTPPPSPISPLSSPLPRIPSPPLPIL
nr:putative reverse transcriptase domain-containing protein [Tanacetum cinerariifolium]